MLSSKIYLKILFSILGIILFATFAYAVNFSKEYPIPLTSRISFDAKLKFIREHIDADAVDTIIVGSSLGLNNIQGAHLERASEKCKTVLNLSVYESTALQAEQILELTDAFPNLKRIIYSTQYSDFAHAKKFDEYDAKFLIRYIRKELNPVEEKGVILRACNDISFCLKRQKEWEKEHGMNNKFTYLGFDATGSVPLHIYGKDIIGHRWNNPHPNIQNPKSFEAVYRMAERAKNKNIRFYLVQQPYREPLAKNHKNVQAALDFFAKKNSEIVSKLGGKFLSLHETLHLDDKYFADRSHLNDQGSIIAAEAVGKFIDENEN